MIEKSLYIEVLKKLIEKFNHRSEFYCLGMQTIIEGIKDKINSDESVYWVYYNLKRNNILPDKGTLFDKKIGCFNRDKAINDLRKYKLKMLVYDE